MTENKELYLNAIKYLNEESFLELMNKKERTVGRSFRLKEQWLNILSEDAEREGISPNALLNKILQNYCLYVRYLRRFSTVTLSEELFSGIIGACPREQLVKLGKIAGSTAAQDTLKSLGLGHNRKDIDFYLRDIIGRYSGWFTYFSNKTNEKEMLHLRHNMGENWSIYVSEALSTLYENILEIRVKTEYSANTVTFEVPFGKQP